MFRWRISLPKEETDFIIFLNKILYFLKARNVVIYSGEIVRQIE